MVTKRVLLPIRTTIKALFTETTAKTLTLLSKTTPANPVNPLLQRRKYFYTTFSNTF
jgi:hypothetical protein